MAERGVKKSASILVSACLLGVRCRHDGQHRLDQELVELLMGQTVLPVCPEELGGLEGLRGPFEMQGDAQAIGEGVASVVSEKGDDVTSSFCQGAWKVVALGKDHGAGEAILKSKSHSCSPDQIYDGTFRGHLTMGCGVCAYLLKKEGIAVTSSAEYKARSQKESKA